MLNRQSRRHRSRSKVGCKLHPVDLLQPCRNSLHLCHFDWWKSRSARLLKVPNVSLSCLSIVFGLTICPWKLKLSSRFTIFHYESFYWRLLFPHAFGLSWSPTITLHADNVLSKLNDRMGKAFWSGGSSYWFPFFPGLEPGVHWHGPVIFPDFPLLCVTIFVSFRSFDCCATSWYHSQRDAWLAELLNTLAIMYTIICYSQKPESHRKCVFLHFVLYTVQRDHRARVAIIVWHFLVTFV